MAATERLVCDSAQLVEGGKGLRFAARHRGAQSTAFLVRYGGSVYGYLNSCAHIPIELDWVEGEFFDHSGLYLICSTHGATYEPDTGHCIMGPCKGQRLTALPVIERDGKIYVLESENHDG